VVIFSHFWAELFFNIIMSVLGLDVMIANFRDLCGKNDVFLKKKNNVKIAILAKTSSSLSKKTPSFCRFFGEPIFDIIESAPDPVIGQPQRRRDYRHPAALLHAAARHPVRGDPERVRRLDAQLHRRGPGRLRLLQDQAGDTSRNQIGFADGASETVKARPFLLCK
jgi:hypothetical protein